MTPEHPHPDYEWGCPDCGSTDVAKTHDGSVRNPTPGWYCRACGVRFWEPSEVLVS